ncbi:hypothetical protein [Streptomyces sp. TP-A0356]|uniref:hypothetical protein n=1 Tax=Streptomyces sp. TP-A0356 TaxID=1359208 RepID=UPI0006E3D5B3|nr:hypothetical protein [Streptomyces sp. TP-A0356]
MRTIETYDRSGAAVARRWTLVVLGAAAMGLVPWMVLLAQTLPGSPKVRNWQVAWVGLDVLLAAGCAATALLGLRGHVSARLTASATAAVAVLDAWFDITTSLPGSDLARAYACAVAEGVLAGACLFLAVSRRTGITGCG